MSENKVITKEQLEEKINKLEIDFNTSLKVEKKLAQKLAMKEHELALLSVQFEEVVQGFSTLKEKYEEENKAE